jgi:hypothetical protein
MALELLSREDVDTLLEDAQTRIIFVSNGMLDVKGVYKFWIMLSFCCVLLCGKQKLSSC